MQIIVCCEIHISKWVVSICQKMLWKYNVGPIQLLPPCNSTQRGLPSCPEVVVFPSNLTFLGTCEAVLRLTGLDFLMCRPDPQSGEGYVCRAFYPFHYYKGHKARQCSLSLGAGQAISCPTMLNVWRPGRKCQLSNPTTFLRLILLQICWWH